LDSRGSRSDARSLDRLRIAVALAVAVASLASGPGAAANPLRLISVKRLDPRLEQLAFRTPAVTGLTRVRVLLPSGYRSHLARRYPVLYLLHGAADDFTAWTAEGDAERITARHAVLVVMPTRASPAAT